MKTSIRPESGGVQSEHTLAKQQTSAPYAEHDASYHDSEARDIKTPKLGLVGKIGPLSETFPKNVGEFAYNGRVLLGTALTPGPGVQAGEFGLTVIPVSFKKRWVETHRDSTEIKFGMKIDPPQKRFESADAAYKAGYAIDFDAPKVNNVEQEGELVLLVSGPKDDPEDAFFLKIGEEYFTPAIYTVRRGSFKDVYKNIATWYSRPGSLVHNKLCTLSSKLIKNEARRQSWFESRITAKAKLSPEDIARIEAAVPAFIMPASPSLPETPALQA